MPLLSFDIQIECMIVIEVFSIIGIQKIFIAFFCWISAVKVQFKHKFVCLYGRPSHTIAFLYRWISFLPDVWPIVLYIIYYCNLTRFMIYYFFAILSFFFFLHSTIFWKARTYIFVLKIYVFYSYWEFTKK